MNQTVSQSILAELKAQKIANIEAIKVQKEMLVLMFEERMSL